MYFMHDDSVGCPNLSKNIQSFMFRQGRRRIVGEILSEKSYLSSRSISEEKVKVSVIQMDGHFSLGTYSPRLHHFAFMLTFLLFFYSPRVSRRIFSSLAFAPFIIHSIRIKDIEFRDFYSIEEKRKPSGYLFVVLL